MKKLSILISVCIVNMICMSSCKLSEAISPTNQPDDDKPAFGFGWLGNEDLGKVPNNVKFGFASNTNLPTSFDLSELLPPIASQGSYGTCISWATELTRTLSQNKRQIFTALFERIGLQMEQAIF